MPNAPTERSPVIFVSHGSPLMAIADNDYTRALAAGVAGRPRPAAIVVVSAHWRGRRRLVGAARHPSTIHDFGGFPDELFQISYPCPGSPMLAQRIADRLGGEPERDRGLDHGVWVPLRHMFPDATIPVVPVALPTGATPGSLIDLGRQLAYLRAEGVWIMGTGGLVHNLGQLAEPDAPPPDWARAFDRWAGDRIASFDLAQLTEYRRAPYANLAVPTPEHFDPVFVVLGAALPGDRVTTIAEGFELGTISLRSFVLSDGPIRG